MCVAEYERETSFLMSRTPQIDAHNVTVPYLIRGMPSETHISLHTQVRTQKVSIVVGVTVVCLIHVQNISSIENLPQGTEHFLALI